MQALAIIVQISIAFSCIFYGLVRAITGLPIWPISVVNPKDPNNQLIAKRYQKRQIFKHRLYVFLIGLVIGILIAVILIILMPELRLISSWIIFSSIIIAFGIMILGELLAKRKSLLLMDSRVMFPLKIQYVVRKLGKNK